MPAPSAPVVSIIVVSADSGAGLRECVQRALATDLPLEVIVADNGSSDGAPQAVEAEHAGDDRLQVHYHGANLGFGPAINRAARSARGAYLLLLNPDCLLEPDTIGQLLEVARTHPQAGVIGAVVCDAHGRPDPASYRRDPLLRRALASLLGTPGQTVNIAGGVPGAVVPAEAVSGALLLMPRPAFDRLGGFDERYFLHCEDLDLCRRARDAGLAVLLAGPVRVLHGKGGSSRHRPVFVSRHKHRGMWRWFRTFDPAGRNPLLAALVWLGIWGHFLALVPGQWWRARKAARRPS